MWYDNELGVYGNFGHLDQVLAIEFMYNNSKAFGGDPENIIMYIKNDKN